MSKLKGSNLGSNPKYRKGKYDSLWESITKAYFRAGIPRLFNLKKKSSKKSKSPEPAQK